MKIVIKKYDSQLEEMVSSVVRSVKKQRAGDRGLRTGARSKELGARSKE